MQRTSLRVLLAFIFIGLLASAAFLNRRVGPSANVSASGDSAAQRYGFRLEEISHTAGIDFTHQAPTLDSQLAHIMPQVASMGAGVSVVDYDNDGWPDIYVTNSAEGSSNHLYHNLHDGRFEDIAAKLGIADVNQTGTGVSMGAVWGDFDNDGYEDLLLYKWGKPELFHNDGGKGFTRVTEKAGLPAWVNANSAIWLDYDCDGHLDLLLCGYYSENIDLWHLKTTRIMPESFEYANNGGRKYLLRNRGDGTFEDVTEKVGLNSHRWTLAVGAADLRGTGYPDLVFANDYGVTELYLNQAGQGFREVGKQANIGYRPKSGMNVAFGDVGNQGQYAIYVTNISAEGNLIQGNNLWVPRPTSSNNAAPVYDNMASDSGVELGGWSFGAQFGDLNNDGSLDLVLTNGYVSANRDKSYWYDFGKIAIGNGAIIGDAKNWPPMTDRSLSGYEQKRLWLNDGYGKFTDVAQAVGLNETYDGRAIALADLWNCGSLDVLVAAQRGPFRLYRNAAAPENRWLELELKGTRSNRSAIGAQAQCFWKDAKGQEKQQVQTVTGGIGFCAQNQRRLHFGLGKDAQLEKIEIRWPIASGKTQTVTGLEVNKIHRIEEPK